MGAMKYWLWLSGEERLSPKARAAVANWYEDAERAFFAPAGDYKNVPGLSASEAAALEKRDLSRAEKILELCTRQGIEIITLQDARYPKRLRSIFAPPVVLYVKGKLPDVDNRPAVAVIGTRKASPYGMKMGRAMAYEISKGGGIVISGLTEGIDRSAAQGCLQAGGCCIGVLGVAHGKETALQRELLKNGALVSEFAPGALSRKSHFRDRNRISAGLSHGVTVVEAPAESGALLFAAEALELGRELFAVPGNADAPNSVGTISLIKQGAKPVTCGWDVLTEFEYLFPGKLSYPGDNIELPPLPEELEEKSPAKAEKPREATIKDIDKKKSAGYIDLREQLSELNEEQLKIISAIDSDSHIDDIIESTGLSTAKVLAQLTILEIKGYVRRSAGRRISLNIKSK